MIQTTELPRHLGLMLLYPPCERPPTPPPKDKCYSPDVTTGYLESQPPLTPQFSHSPLAVQTPIHVIRSPQYTAKLRYEAEKQRKCEEEQARQEEEERRARKKRQKEEEELQEKQMEADRLATLQQELRQAAAHRRARQEEERQLEEQLLRTIKEKREKDRDRRLEHTRRLEQWRVDYIQRSISSSSEEEDLRRGLAEDRRNRITKLGDQLLRHEGVAKGWVTIQPPGSSIWKRRFYKFDLSKGEMLLYSNHVVRIFASP